MTNFQAIQRLHADCGCVARTASAEFDEPVTVTYMGCRLLVLGLRLVIECDECSAFGSSDPKPDLLILRKARNGYEWLVVEIKTVMDRDAIRQVQSGIDKIADSRMFSPFSSTKFAALFANKKANRTANVDVLRKSLKFQGRPVPSRVERCGNNKQL